MNSSATGSTPRNKKTHNEGDLHYGFSDNRNDGINKMALANTSLSKDPSFDDPKTIDNLNDYSRLSKILKSKNDDGKRDLIANYFTIIEKLEAYTPEPGDESKAHRWVAYLKDNIESLKLDKEINQLREPGARNVSPSKIGRSKAHRWVAYLKDNIKRLKLDKEINQLREPRARKVSPSKDRYTKDRYTKNFLEPRSPNHAPYLIKALVEGFRSKKNVSPSYYDKNINNWVHSAFIRKTSKLGIDFALKEGNVIHFNTYSNFCKPQNTMMTDAITPKRKYNPITHSVLRHINRTVGYDHPQIDMYSLPPDVDAFQRNSELGNIPNYKNKRLSEGKPVPKVRIRR